MAIRQGVVFQLLFAGGDSSLGDSVAYHKGRQIHLTQRAQSVSQRAQRISLKIRKNATPQNGKKPRFHLIFPTKQPHSFLILNLFLHS
jgi:hypothetical protein